MRSLGWIAIEWIEQWVPLGPGDVEGTPFHLDDEECRFLLRVYELDDDGSRRFDEELYSRPKGRRKTDLAGALICFEALGPCRFERWGRGRTPVGRRVKWPFIRVLATEEGQATRTAYATAAYQLGQIAASHGGEFSGLDVGLTRTFLPGGGEIRPSAANAASKDGGKESFCVAEETHLYTTEDLRGMYATVMRNMTKRPLAEPHMLQVSTMFAPGQGSIAEATHQAAEEGQPRLLLDHRQAPDLDIDQEALRREDPKAVKALRAALVDVYGDAAEWADFLRIQSKFTDPKVDLADAIRYYLNRPVRSAGSWLRPGEWDRNADDGAAIEVGARITLGFDGARYFDSTVLVAVDLVSGLVNLLGLWEQPVNVADGDWEVPYGEVMDAVANAQEMYDVVRFYPDPPYWESAVDEWAGEWPGRVFKFPTSRYQRMVWAIRAVETAIRAGELRHDGDPGLARHVTNARRRPTGIKDPETRQPMHVLAKAHRSSRLKMDAAVAMVAAWEARRDAIAAGALNTDEEEHITVGFS